jgi:hypothetical protein
MEGISVQGTISLEILNVLDVMLSISRMSFTVRNKSPHDTDTDVANSRRSFFSFKLSAMSVIIIFTPE